MFSKLINYVNSTFPAATSKKQMSEANKDFYIAGEKAFTVVFDSIHLVKDSALTVAKICGTALASYGSIGGLHSLNAALAIGAYTIPALGGAVGASASGVVTGALTFLTLNPLVLPMGGAALGLIFAKNEIVDATSRVINIANDVPALVKSVFDGVTKTAIAGVVGVKELLETANEYVDGMYNTAKININEDAEEVLVVNKEEKALPKFDVLPIEIDNLSKSWSNISSMDDQNGLNAIGDVDNVDLSNSAAIAA